MDLTAIVLPSTPPSIPPNARAGGWGLEADDEGNVFWVWEEDVPSPRVEEALAVGDAQIAALKADVRARRQVCRRAHGAPFSENSGIVALARAALGQ